MLVTIVVLLLAWRAIWSRSTRGRSRRAIATGLLIGSSIVVRLRSRVGGWRLVGSFVGHCCGVWWVGG